VPLILRFSSRPFSSFPFLRQCHPLRSLVRFSLLVGTCLSKHCSCRMPAGSPPPAHQGQRAHADHRPHSIFPSRAQHPHLAPPTIPSSRGFFPIGCVVFPMPFSAMSKRRPGRKQSLARRACYMAFRGPSFETKPAEILISQHLVGSDAVRACVPIVPTSLSPLALQAIFFVVLLLLSRQCPHVISADFLSYSPPFSLLNLVSLSLCLPAVAAAFESPRYLLFDFGREGAVMVARSSL